MSGDEPLYTLLHPDGTLLQYWFEAMSLTYCRGVEISATNHTPHGRHGQAEK